MEQIEVSGRVEFPDATIKHEDGVDYIPFIGVGDGRVGYRVHDHNTGREAFLYLCPSEGGASPDVFLYTGETSDPGSDTSFTWFRSDIPSLVEGVPVEPQDWTA